MSEVSRNTLRFRNLLSKRIQSIIFRWVQHFSAILQNGKSWWDAAAEIMRISTQKNLVWQHKRSQGTMPPNF